MQLILWRHAEAEDNAPTDLLRPLTARGKKQAATMASWFRAHAGVGPWRAIASPALRAQETVAALELPFETVSSIAPDASPQAIIRAANWPNVEGGVIVVGHQPTLGMVAAKLINGEDGYVAVKKAAMWWFETRQRGERVETVLRTMTTPDSVR